MPPVASQLGGKGSEPEPVLRAACQAEQQLEHREWQATTFQRHAHHVLDLGSGFAQETVGRDGLAVPELSGTVHRLLPLKRLVEPNRLEHAPDLSHTG